MEEAVVSVLRRAAAHRYHNLRHTFATMYFNEVDNKNPEPWLLIKELLGTPAWKPPEIFT
jgi:integrase